MENAELKDALAQAEARIAALEEALRDIVGMTAPAQADPWPWLEEIEKQALATLNLDGQQGGGE